MATHGYMVTWLHSYMGHEIYTLYVGHGHMVTWSHGTWALNFIKHAPGRLGANPTGRLGDNPTGRLGDNPTGRLGDNPTGRLGDNNPTGRLGALFPYWCSSGAMRPFLQQTQFMYGQDAVVMLLGFPARPMSVNTHADINGELLGRPLT
jgi:hypothetical protein